MCYDAQTQLRRQIKDAIHLGGLYETQALKMKLMKLEMDFDESGIQDHYYHVSGYNHPLMFIYTNIDPLVPTLAIWGLIPEDCSTKDDALKIRNMTLNARSETLIERKSFAPSFENKRCVVYLEGFYEHFHKHGKTYPHLITMKSGELLPMAGLYADWVDPNSGEEIRTFSIVTTTANSMMRKIHNNPKLSNGPRMPVILGKDNIMDWLTPKSVTSKDHQENILKLCVPIDSSKLSSRTVAKLKGKNTMRNVPEITQELIYPELAQNQNTLFPDLP
jgi:putative SOS response-associated peptidase YedK